MNSTDNTQPENDAEGHMPRIRVGQDEETSETADTAGHMPRIRVGQDEGEQDDAEGHMPFRNYVPTPPPSAIGGQGNPTDPRR
jgi:hypothetical protein